MMYEFKRSLSLRDFSSSAKILRDFKKGNQEVSEGFEQDPNFLKFVDLGLIAEALPENPKGFSFAERNELIRQKLHKKAAPVDAVPPVVTEVVSSQEKKESKKKSKKEKE